ncbi:MAG: aroA [Chlamydiales bacterium]|jgi:3-phosphoshikimate 1-carboxyvinyltransferase|nr:aroA [Chlamydiales bacterium]
MRYSIQRSALSGMLSLPASKSQTLRAVLFASLADGKSTLFNCLESPDLTAMIEACRLFGAQITLSSEKMEVEGVNGEICLAKGAPLKIDAGNSGIVLRFSAAIAALSSLPVAVSGDAALSRQRPMQPLLSGLAQLGAATASLQKEGYAPVLVQGPLQGGIAVINGADSQPVSALLIAAAFAPHETELIVENAGEKPWVALTLNWFDRLNIAYKQSDFSRYRLFGNSRYLAFSYRVPGDLSSLAFPVVAALITGSTLTIGDVDFSDPQGDKELISILQQMRADISYDIDQKTLTVRGGSPLEGVSIDINACIDALPILAVAACYAKGSTRIYNGAIARHKECDRIRAVAKELKKMGALIAETADGLLIEGSSLKGTDLHAYQDHRMVMALTVAAMGAEGSSTVDSIECVAKTFPHFLAEFQRLGASLEAVS